MNKLMFAWLPVYCEDTNDYQWFTNVYKHTEHQGMIKSLVWYTTRKLVCVYE